jgi:hypothetical protein
VVPSVAQGEPWRTAPETAVHWPRLLQALHRSVQAALQHTLSAQNVDLHSNPSLQAAPGSFFVTHEVPLQ